MICTICYDLAMATTSTRHRVGFLETLARGGFDRPVLGALKYAAQIDRWDLVGESAHPYVNLDQISPEHVDGLIGFINTPELEEAVVATGVPTVNTSNRFADSKLPRVGHDEQAIGRLGAEHLLACGFSHFGFVSWADAWFSQQRAEAFAGIIERAGHKCHILSDVHPGRRSIEVLRAWMKALPKPVAVMSYADVFGTEIIRIAHELGLAVPQDMAVLSVGNEWLATMMSRPPLSSIDIDAEQVGYRAAQLLDELMADQAADWPRWVEPIGVAERRSTQIVSHDDPLITAAMSFIRDHCTRGIDVTDLLNEFEVSRTTLETRLKRATGLTPHAAICRARIDRAKHLLSSSEDNLGQIARACGFDRQDQFCHVFKRITGVTPGRFRHQRGG